MGRMVAVVFFGLLVAGCATSASVKKELEPLEQRVTALEKQQAATNAKLDAQAADLAALRKNVSDASAASAARAEQAAKDAAAAADRAESAAQKSTKAFELGQVKGGKK